MVFDLAENYLDKGHRTYFDKYYSTVKLMQENRWTYACGTIRSDRGRFLDSFKEKLERGESRFLRIGKLVAAHWRDKRDVYACSTIQGTGVEILERKHGNPITKPKIIIGYNNHMNGVDKCDQFLELYPFCRKTVKWWKKVFVECLNWQLSIVQ